MTTMEALMLPDVLAATAWQTNGEMIRDVARLRYLFRTDRVLDPTWGLGRWWTHWRPDDLVGSDIDPVKSPVGESVDFTALPWPDNAFDVVAFDPPYKLNGTPTDGVDNRYGTHVVRSWQDRHTLIRDGITECARVARRVLLLKCQDQVCSGAVRWQTDEFTRHAESLDCVKIDRLDFLAHRPQPPGRRQVHARRNASTLLIFRVPQ